MGKDTEIFGLGKVPDSALLKLSQQEVGQLKSYIDELQYEIEELKKANEELASEFKSKCQKCDQEARKELRKDELYKLSLERNLQLRKDKKKLIAEKESVIYQKIKLEQRITELEQKLAEPKAE